MSRSLLLASAIALTVQSTPFGANKVASPFRAPKAARESWRPLSQPVNHSQVLKVVLALKRRNMDQLEALFWSISDPNSKGYGNRMSPEAVRVLISPGAQVIRAVTTWLQQHGVAEVSVSAHEDYITVGATVGQLEELFGLRFQVYENGDGKRLTRSMDRVVIPEEFADVIAVVHGVADLPTPSRRQRVAMRERDPADRVVTPQVYMDAYNITGHEPKPIPGKQNIQTFFEFNRMSNEDDLKKFCSKYLPDIPLEQCTVKQLPGSDASTESSDFDAHSQYIFGLSGGAETWSYSPTTGNNFCTAWALFSQKIFAGPTYPFVASVSYMMQQSRLNLCSAAQIQNLEEDWKKLGALGVSVIVASGDWGTSYNGQTGFFGQLLYPSWPASSPYVTAVGGTSFQQNTGSLQKALCGSFFIPNEIYCSPLNGMSGGGFSFDQDAPDYQQATVSKYIAADKGLPPKACWASEGVKRGTPDVSILAYNLAFIYQGEDQEITGTDAATPAFAGMMTRLNWVRMKDDGKTLGFLNPLFYSHPDVFTDIVIGNNDLNYNGFGYEAVEGWDATTGLGVPNFGKMQALVDGLKGREGSEYAKLPPLTSGTVKSESSPDLGTSSGSASEITVQPSDVWVTSADGRTILVVSQALNVDQKLSFYDVESKSFLQTYVADQYDSSYECDATSGAGSFACLNTEYDVKDHVRVFTRVGSNIENTEMRYPPVVQRPGYTQYLQDYFARGNAGYTFFDSDGFRTLYGYCRNTLFTYEKSQHLFGLELLCFSYSQNAMVLNHFIPAVPGNSVGVEDIGIWVSPDVTKAILSQGQLVQTTGNCTVNGTVMGLTNSNFLTTTGLYDFNTCRLIKALSINPNPQEHEVIEIEDSFVLVTHNASLSTVVSYSADGTATTLVSSGSEGRFDNVVVRSILRGRTVFLTLQGKQYMIEISREGVPTLTAFGRIPAMPTYGFLGIPPGVQNLFDVVIHQRDGSFLIPHLQGGNVYRKESKGSAKQVTPVHSYRETTMMQVMQGAGGLVVYEPAPGGQIYISEAFNPVKHGRAP